MTSKITSKEVLAYLNYLGYNNVNAQQLKEFVQDLKKLIKYEERKKSQENIYADLTSPPNGTSDYVDAKFKENVVNLAEPFHDIFSTLYAQGTCASKAKTVTKKESVISLQIKKNKCHHHCKHHDKENISESAQEKVENSEKLEGESENLQILTKTSGRIISDSKKSSLKRKSSFIRPTIQISNKSDPVALYHFYKGEWKRHKVPGEDQRTELRWAIREKMLRGPRT